MARYRTLQDFERIGVNNPVLRSYALVRCIVWYIRPGRRPYHVFHRDCFEAGWRFFESSRHHFLHGKWRRKGKNPPKRGGGSTGWYFPTPIHTVCPMFPPNGLSKRPKKPITINTFTKICILFFTNTLASFPRVTSHITPPLTSCLRWSENTRYLKLRGRGFSQDEPEHTGETVQKRFHKTM